MNFDESAFYVHNFGKMFWKFLRAILAKCWLSSNPQLLRRMDGALRLLMMSSLLSSWFPDCNKWAFQHLVLCLAWEITKDSSFSLSEHSAVSEPSSISRIRDETSKQRSQRSQWAWPQVTEYFGSSGSLRAYALQWSGIAELWKQEPENEFKIGQCFIIFLKCYLLLTVTTV